MRGIFYAIMLTLACLAALMLGYSFGTTIEVRQDTGVAYEDQATFDSYNDYESHVAGVINGEINDRQAIR